MLLDIVVVLEGEGTDVGGRTASRSLATIGLLGFIAALSVVAGASTAIAVLLAVM